MLGDMAGRLGTTITIYMLSFDYLRAIESANTSYISRAAKCGRRPREAKAPMIGAYAAPLGAHFRDTTPR